MSNLLKAKILIVEDEPQINRLIELILQSEGYYNILKSYDGQSAFKIIEKEKPDLILLDVMIPEIDGFSLCKMIKEIPDFSSIQIIMLTARKMEEDILQGFENGAIDYISKPFNNKILLARIKAHLKNTELTSYIQIYQNIELNNKKKIAKIDDKEVNLTKFEYILLQKFISNPGIVFSRTQLLSYLRGDDGFNISERAIDFQIVNLRKNLGFMGHQLKQCVVLGTS